MALALDINLYSAFLFGEEEEERSDFRTDDEESNFISSSRSVLYELSQRILIFGNLNYPQNESQLYQICT